MAFRSVPRPSSPPGAKASTECPYHTPIQWSEVRCQSSAAKYRTAGNDIQNHVPRGSQSFQAQHRIQNLVRSLRRTNKIRINSHNVSEPSLSDLGAFPPCFDTRRQLSRSDINRTAGRTRTSVRFHHTRPETHQNLIHPDKEQNHLHIGD
jgi:hypothetical protein